MKTVCAWCKKLLEDDLAKDGLISHGICMDCLDYFFPKSGPRSFDEFLDLLSVPVLVIDSNLAIVIANKEACRLLGESVGDVEGKRPGVALECPYARLPEGCGQTVHCKSCAVRLTVLDTFTTGRSHYDVPAYSDISFGHNSATIRYRISTEKSGEFVLLRIHEAGDTGSGEMPLEEDEEGSCKPW